VTQGENENTVSERADPQTTEAWPWPDSLDALVAAPAYHARLMENEQRACAPYYYPAGGTRAAPHSSLRRRSLPAQLERFRSPGPGWEGADR
jgi:hypothetical protein